MAVMLRQPDQTDKGSSRDRRNKFLNSFGLGVSGLWNSPLVE